MKFIVKRAHDLGSGYGEYDQPLESAILESIEVTEFRHAANLPKWTNKGRNHRETHDHPNFHSINARDIDAPLWTIEVDSLSDIMAIINKEGAIIIQQEYGEPLPTIVIYDGYIE